MSFPSSPPSAVDGDRLTGAGTDRYPFDRIWRAGALAFGLALVANLVLWAIGRGLLGVSDDFMPLETPIPLVVATLVGMVAATAVFAALVRFTARPERWFVIVAVVFGLLSLSGPLGQRPEPGGDAAAVATLVAMHVASAAAAIYAFTIRTRDS
jgi:Family of unknown function (DUF6069)